PCSRSVSTTCSGRACLRSSRAKQLTMDHSEDNHVDQPALTDDQEQIEAMANESPALRGFEERAEEEAELEEEAAEAVAEEEREEADADEQALADEPTSSADDLSARSGGPDVAEDVEAVVEDEVVDEKEEASFETEVPDVAAATGAADPGTDEDAVAEVEAAAEEDEQPLGGCDDVIDLEDAEPKETIETGDAVLEVGPELAA